MTDLAAIEARHYLYPALAKVPRCHEDFAEWPCDTRLVLDAYHVLLANGPEYYEAALAAAEAALEGAKGKLLALYQLHTAAEADADALAKALRAVLIISDDCHGCIKVRDDGGEPYRAVLAAHDARRHE